MPASSEQTRPTAARAVVGDPNTLVPGGVITRRVGAEPFHVHLEVFSGPFDLLLGLIGKHQLDLTEIALARVTDEFLGHIRAQQEAAEAGTTAWDLSEASQFLLVAATLLDLKAARLLPGREDGDEEDLALIEARDLLFARLLQYRAFKDVAAWCAQRMDCEGRIAARRVSLEPRFADLLPELVMGITPHQLAAIASEALTPRTEPTVVVEHLHETRVNVREQAWVVSGRLRTRHVLSFRSLVADAESTPVVVARFLALLMLFQSGQVSFDQAEAFGELMIRWTATDDDPDLSAADEGSIADDDEW